MGLAGKKSPTVISTINEVLAKLLIGMKLKRLNIFIVNVTQ